MGVHPFIHPTNDSQISGETYQEAEEDGEHHLGQPDVLSSLSLTGLRRVVAGPVAVLQVPVVVATAEIKLN